MKILFNKLIQAGVKFGSENFMTALFNGKDDLILKLVELGVKFNSEDLDLAVSLKKPDIILKLLESGVQPSEEALDLIYDDHKFELAKLCANKEQILNNLLEKKIINYPDIKTHNQLSKYGCLDHSNIKFQLKGDSGYFSPIEGKKMRLSSCYTAMIIIMLLFITESFRLNL